MRKEIASQQELADTAMRAIATLEEQMAELPYDLFLLTNEQADDAAFQALVVAADEDDARNVAANREALIDWPLDQTNVSCLRVGTSSEPNVARHVLMYNYLSKGVVVG